MKVIEKGPGWGMECICTGSGNGGCGCGSKLRVEKEDIYLTHNYDYGGGHDIFFTFRCPVCGVETDLDEDKTPRLIKRELLEGYRNQNRLVKEL